jgi:hypothetical protein
MRVANFALGCTFGSISRPLMPGKWTLRLSGLVFAYDTHSDINCLPNYHDSHYTAIRWLSSELCSEIFL